MLILDALRNRPEGLGRVDLQALAGQADRSALAFRRTLDKLVVRGLVYSSGRTKNLRYHLAPGPRDLRPGTSPRIQTPPRENGEVYPPLSPEAESIRKRLAEPLGLREPVSYQRSFLDAYRPNETFYLPGSLRERLMVAGGPIEPGHPAGTYARQVLEYLLVDLSWASSNMEGNTYTLLDTRELIAKGRVADGKDHRETQMILNHKAAIEYLVESAEGLAPAPGVVKNLHALLMDNLLGNPMDEGRLRLAPVAIQGTTYIPTGVPQVIEECFRQILNTAAAIQDPFEQGFFLLVHLPYLQPFLDGNKRTARLSANIPFIRANCVPITFMDVDPAAFTDGMIAVYETNQVSLLRDVFAFAYERSCARFSAVRKALGEPDPFRLKWRGELKTLVREVILAGEHGGPAAARIQAFAEAFLPREAQARFQAVAETELAGLHEGNFARYQVRPSQFSAWQSQAVPE